MERITATLDEDLVDELDRFQKNRGYQNRSEALRDLVRAGLQEAAQENEAGGACIEPWSTCMTTRSEHLPND